MLVVSLAIGALATAFEVGLPGAALANAIGDRIVCAVGLSGTCEADEDDLGLAYGAELAGLVRDHAPTIHYEDGMLTLPVDYRQCRENGCAIAAARGAVARTDAGYPAAVFVGVVDCRLRSAAATEVAGADCSGERAGNLYLQYWLYFPDSRTDPWGELGFHRDDWESFQVRIGAETVARASSHRSYNYEGGIQNWLSDAGVASKPGWGPYTGELFVAAGSHAGHVAGGDHGERYTPRSRLLLIPIEPMSAGTDPELFAVTPPWLKDVWTDPESEGTG